MPVDNFILGGGSGSVSSAVSSGGASGGASSGGAPGTRSSFFLASQMAFNNAHRMGGYYLVKNDTNRAVWFRSYPHEDFKMVASLIAGIFGASGNSIGTTMAEGIAVGLTVSDSIEIVKDSLKDKGYQRIPARGTFMCRLTAGLDQTCVCLLVPETADDFWNLGCYRMLEAAMKRGLEANGRTALIMEQKDIYDTSCGIFNKLFNSGVSFNTFPTKTGDLFSTPNHYWISQRIKNFHKEANRMAAEEKTKAQLRPRSRL